MYAVGVSKTVLAEAYGGETLFDFFDECAEAGSLGRKEQKEDQAKSTA